jgi:hypothetical protein
MIHLPQRLSILSQTLRSAVSRFDALSVIWSSSVCSTSGSLLSNSPFLVRVSKGLLVDADGRHSINIVNLIVLLISRIDHCLGFIRQLNPM